MKQLVMCFSSCLKDSSSNLTEESKQFGGIVNLEELKAQLRELPVYVEIYNMENSAKLKKITLVSTM